MDLDGIEGLNDSCPAVYRAALKLRSLQKLCHMHMVLIRDLCSALWAVGDLGNISQESLKHSLEQLFQGVLQNLPVQAVPEATEQTARLLFKLYDREKTGFVPLRSVEAALIVLSGDTLSAKHRALFQLGVSCSRRQGTEDAFVSRAGLRNLLDDLSQDPVKAADEITEYKMSSKPCGLCVIINNVNFDPPLKDRYGAHSDEESLKMVFQWLGFSLRVHKNQTAEQMKDLLKTYSQQQHDGDCFVCCIMSHGSSDGVHGTNGTIVSRDDIFGPFSGKSCPSLINKPKVFFIQACRGKEYHLSVEVQPDSYEEEEVEADAEMEDEASFETDAVEMSTLPADADFLVARSTVKGYVSFRETISGSWFIQSLCKQLKKYCPKGEDVQTILLCVNKEVSEKAARLRITGIAKQMPVHKVTLRKKLVFRVPNPQ